MRVIFLCLFSFLLCHATLAVESYADLVEQVMPSVVNISTEKETFNDNEEIDNFMVEPNLAGRESLGSGFFIRHDGYILTNYHVIHDAKTITIITHNGSSHKAKIVGIDKPSDLAVIKIDAPKKHNDFQSVIFGNADEARIGDRVLTFGNPYGLGISVSEGIISAKARNIGVGEQQYIQTDAAINQGNSGGPMFNIEGEVIGINTAIFSSQGASGIGFALPSNIVNWIASQLIDKGKVQRGWIGFNVVPGIDKYTEKSGFLITEIDEESNAYKEGIRVGDIILSYNDTPAEDINAFRLYTETMSVGRALRLKTSTLGEEIRNVIRIQNVPEKALKNIANNALIERNKYHHEETDQNVSYLSELYIAVKEAYPRGLIIVKIDRKSPLADKGIKIGDIILEANREDIFSADNLLDTVQNATLGTARPISLLIQSVDDTFYINIEVTPEND